MSCPESQPVSSPGVDAGAGRVNRTRWLLSLLIVGSYPLVLGMLSLGRPAGRSAILGGSVARLMLVVCMEIGVFGVIFGLGWLASRANRHDLLLAWRPGYWVLPLGLAYSVLLRIVVALITLAVVVYIVLLGIASMPDVQNFLMRNRPDIEAIVDPAVLRSNPVYFWLTVTVVSFVLGGLREELWRSAFIAGVRNMFPDSTRRRRLELIAVCAASGIFGIGHVTQGVLAVGLTGLLGLGLGCIMVGHRSIWPAVMAHGFFNATSLALVPLIVDKLPHLPR